MPVDKTAKKRDSAGGDPAGGRRCGGSDQGGAGNLASWEQGGD